MRKEKIGIMGGTFNPIHIGHLVLAEQAYKQFQLDYIVFIPAKEPPHKPNFDIVSDMHRLNMIALSIEDNAHFKLSSMELDRLGTTYTIDTLRELDECNKNADYYFIIGGDSIFQLETWRAHDEIIRLSKILAASRYSIPDTKIQEQINYLNHKYQGDIQLLRIPTIDLSSKMIRNSIKEGKTVKYYIKEAVMNYIKENGLYE